MTIYLFAGTNGSGKSTVLVDYIRIHNLECVEYVCQGFHNANFFSKRCIESARIKNFHLYKMNRLLNERKSMIIEHALENTEIIDFLQKAKQVGYRIISIFVYTSSPFVNMRRVKQRVCEGGHGVTSAKIVKRYFQALYHYPALERASDEVYVYNNSKKLQLKKASIDGYWYDID